jgi:glycosyltransferase involved in cell wall biosynthesis
MRMVFHHPLPVRPDAQSASGIRPDRMLEAFRTLGYEVDAVCGYSAERARAIAEVDQRLRRGERYAFLYGESSTEPTALTDRHHLPTRPLLDFAFFARLKASAVPLGLFYRDIYWRFPGYGTGLPWWKAAGAQLFYRWDLVQYRRLLDRLYLPSMAMARHVPLVDPARMRALPPACIDRPVGHRPAAALRLLYIGGIGPHYRMHELFRALDSLPEVRLTVCTREAEWQAVRDQYPLPAAGNIRVVHRSGAGLVELFEQADLGMLCVEPHAYWEFAAPVKLYEYVGAGRPVVASAGTLSAEFVQSQGVGWTCPYDAAQIAALLRRLRDDRSLVDDKLAAVARIRPEHTWAARARQVVSDLMGAR